jgi:23S rRNA (guanine745-N1)-methyltransferase
MHVSALTNLACPLDAGALSRTGATYRCAAGHSFDIAREGHCNLLVVQQKASLDPGDSKAMVAARQRVLLAGHFAPLAAHLFTNLIAPLAGNQSAPLSIVDAGCGEGDYLDRIAAHATESPLNGHLKLAGIDVSKWAVKAAAKRKAPITWLVANNRTPPFPRASVDLILCLFGFPVWDGFTTVQAKGAHIALVDPGTEHLIELREIIYPTVQRSTPPALTQAEAAGYREVGLTNLRFQTHLPTADAIRDLTDMTPHAHRMPLSGRQALAQLSQLTVTIDVAIRRLCKIV